MAAEPPADEDAGMRSGQPSSSAEPALVASAHALQRAAGDLQKHASATEYVPTLGVTLGMLQMANGLVQWCGDEGLSVDEPGASSVLVGWVPR